MRSILVVVLAVPALACVAVEPDAASVPPTRPQPASPVSLRTFTLAVAGDLLTHGPVVESAAENGAAVGRDYDFGPLLSTLAPVVAPADLALCHLEVPIAPDDVAPQGYPTFAAPVELIDGIRAAGYDGCSTASNHSLDQGLDGVVATLDGLDGAGLGHVGTARHEEESVTPAWYRPAGVDVAHLSYAYGFNGIPLPAEAPWAANLIDAGRVLADATAARQAGADFVVVSLHWGVEYQHEPTAEQRALAADLLAWPDIDLLVGHHAHVVQPIERIDGEFVIFGTGNQLSNQGQPERRDGLTVVATITERAGRFGVTALRAVPTWVDLESHRVLPVVTTLADPATDADLRDELEASLVRTMAVVNSRGGEVPF